MTIDAAQIDAMFTDKLTEHEKAGGTEADCKEYYSNIWNGDVGCFADPGRLKVAPGCEWACAWANMEVKQALDCSGNEGSFKCGDWWWPSCESMTAMMTAICTDSAETIKTEIDQIRGDGNCKNTADGGVVFGNTPIASGGGSGGTTFCKNDADFLPDAVLGDGTTCAASKDIMLGSFAAGTGGTWSDITCQEVLASGYGFDDPYPSGKLYQLLDKGPTCCGSLAKTMCFDSNNPTMCTDEAHFQKDTSLAWSPQGYTCQTHLAGFFEHMPGDNAVAFPSCDVMKTLEMGRDSDDKPIYMTDSLGHVSGCCGGLENTRCQHTTPQGSVSVCADPTKMLGDKMFSYFCREYDANPLDNLCPTGCSTFEDLLAEDAESRYGCECTDGVTSEQECMDKWGCLQDPASQAWTCATPSGNAPRGMFGMYCKDLALYGVTMPQAMCTTSPDVIRYYANACCSDMQSICSAGAGGGGGGGIQDLMDASFAGCSLHQTWQDMIESSEWETRFATGGLGKMMEEDHYEVWLCDSQHACALGDMMCFTFNEQSMQFEPLGLNSHLKFVTHRDPFSNLRNCPLLHGAVMGTIDTETAQFQNTVCDELMSESCFFETMKHPQVHMSAWPYCACPTLKAWNDCGESVECGGVEDASTGEVYFPDENYCIDFDAQKGAQDPKGCEAALRWTLQVRDAHTQGGQHDGSKCSDNGNDCCAHEDWSEPMTCRDGYVAIPKLPAEAPWCVCPDYDGGSACYGCYPPGTHGAAQIDWASVDMSEVFCPQGPDFSNLLNTCPLIHGAVTGSIDTNSTEFRNTVCDELMSESCFIEMEKHPDIRMTVWAYCACPTRKAWNDCGESVECGGVEDASTGEVNFPDENYCIDIDAQKGAQDPKGCEAALRWTLQVRDAMEGGTAQVDWASVDISQVLGCPNGGRRMDRVAPDGGNRRAFKSFPSTFLKGKLVKKGKRRSAILYRYIYVYI